MTSATQSAIVGTVLLALIFGVPVLSEMVSEYRFRRAQKAGKLPRYLG